MTSKVKELQIFVQALDLIAGEEWVPTSTQWQTLKQKILDLPDEELPPPATRPQYPNTVPEPSYPVPALPTAASLFGESSQRPIPSVPMGRPNPAMTSSGEQKATLPLNADGTVNKNAFV